MRQVDSEVVEPSAAFGARPRQILWDVQLPLALPTNMTGVNQMIMLTLTGPAPQPSAAAVRRTRCHQAVIHLRETLRIRRTGLSLDTRRQGGEPWKRCSRRCEAADERRSDASLLVLLHRLRVVAVPP
ncbi:hypothetical protein [Jidongwangia harbinensis]|uniref:hypothetical protein n=1 Tax=Jidongwangia harbinensis TaxID=2878561 RepID=UPI001CD931AC|nr:hypothetical protein [Jidongwangia harbinensis]MCA2219017.1 hypothetical protein [Jidongwangia harbinensis]